MGYRVLVIGRSRSADIRLRDRSVSRLHAELVVAEDGRLHVTDRSSANGTWIDAGGRWERVRHHAVTPRDRLRFGSLAVEVSAMLRRVSVRQAAGRPAGDREAGRSATNYANDLPKGPVRRNPETGEVIAADPGAHPPPRTPADPVR